MSFGELDRELRDRILSLDEPVARDDWDDVLARARRRHRPRPSSLLAAATLVVGLVVGFSLAVVVRPSSPSATGVAVTACDPRGQPLCASWSDGQVVGAVSLARATAVRITFSDGSTVVPRISRTSVPSGSGVFVYPIPPGKQVTDVSALGNTLAHVMWYSL